MAPYSRPGDRVTAHDCSTVDLDTITPLKSLPDSDDDSGSMNSGDNGDTQMSLENDPKFFARVTKFTIAFVGLMTSYWTWTYMQDKIIMTEFNPTEQVPNGMFPSITFCVFSNRLLAAIVAIMAVKLRGSNVVPFMWLTPCAVSNTMTSLFQYASIRYVSFPVQPVLQSSKIIPIMLIGKICKEEITYSALIYIEALLIWASFFVAKDNSEVTGLLYMLCYISFDSFTTQWQSYIYDRWGKSNVDPFQVMLGINTYSMIITSIALIFEGDLPDICEFFKANPNVLIYNIISAITSTIGQVFLYYAMGELVPLVFAIIITSNYLDFF